MAFEKYITTTWASSGLKRDIPNQPSSVVGAASFVLGFPAANFAPEEAGGVPPDGTDMNGILYVLSRIAQEIQAGTLPQYVADMSTAIGGYPKGALLLGSDGITFYQNIINANTSEPETGEGWRRLHIYGESIGKIDLMPFRTSELPSGWYHANGDQYAIISEVGKALQSLSTAYKTDWGIIESSGMINLPNLYYSDGRAYFPRFGSSPAVVQDDAIRNITGGSGQDGVSGGSEGALWGAVGAFSLGDTRSGVAKYSNAGFGTTRLFQFNAGLVVPTASENRPLNISFVPSIYLGV